MGTTRTLENTAALGKGQPKAKILMSKNILHFASNVYKAKTMPQGPNQIQLADCCNPLLDFSQHTDEGETWLNKFLHTVNLRTANTYGTFSQNTELTDDSVIKISRFLRDYYGENIAIDAFNYSRPFILATLRENLLRIKEAFQNDHLKYKEQLEIVISICYAVVEQKKQWNDFPTLTKVSRAFGTSAEDIQFSKLMSQVIENTNSKISELALKCKSQMLRNSTTCIYNLLKENIIPNLRGALLHFIFASPNIPEDLFTDATYAALFADEHFTWETFKKNPRLEKDDLIFKFVKNAEIFAIIKDYFFTSRLHKLREKLDEETIKARKRRLSKVMHFATKNAPEKSKYLIEDTWVSTEAREQESKDETAVLSSTSQDLSQFNPHMLLSSIITADMRTVAAHYQHSQQSGQREDDLLAVLPSLFSKTLRLFASIFSTTPVYHPPLFLMRNSPEKDSNSLKILLGKAKDAYLFWKDAIFYAVKKENKNGQEEITIEKLPIVEPYHSENLKKELSIEHFLQQDSAYRCVHQRLKFLHAEAIFRMTGHAARKLPKDIQAAIILEKYLGILNDSFTDLNKISEIQSDMEHILKDVSGLGNTLKIFGYYQCLTLYNDIKMAKGNLIKNLYDLRQFHNNLRKFYSLNSKHWTDSADTAQTKTQRVITALNTQLENQLSLLAASLSMEDIVANMDEAADSLVCLMARQTLLGGHALSISPAYPILELMNVEMHYAAKAAKSIEQAASTAKSALMDGNSSARARLMQQAYGSSAKGIKFATDPPSLQSSFPQDSSDEKITYEELLKAPLPRHPQLTLADILNGEIIEISGQYHLEVDGKDLIALDEETVDFIQTNLTGLLPKSPKSSKNVTNPIITGAEEAVGSPPLKQQTPDKTGLKAQATATTKEADKVSTAQLLIAQLQKEKNRLWDYSKTIGRTRNSFYRYNDFSFTVFQPSWWWLLWITGAGLVVHGILMLGAGLYRWFNRNAIANDLQIYCDLDEGAHHIEKRIKEIVEQIKVLQQKKSSVSCDETEKLLINHLRNEEQALLSHQKIIQKIQLKFDLSRDFYHLVRNPWWYLSWITGIGLIIHGALLLATTLDYSLREEAIAIDKDIFTELGKKENRVVERIDLIQTEIEERANNIGKGASQPVKAIQAIVGAPTKLKKLSSSPSYKNADPVTLFSTQGQKPPTLLSLTKEEEDVLQPDKMNFYVSKILERLLADTSSTVPLKNAGVNGKGQLFGQLSNHLNKIGDGPKIKNIGVRQKIYEATCDQLSTLLTKYATQLLEKLTASTIEDLKTKTKNTTFSAKYKNDTMDCLFVAAFATINEAVSIQNKQAQAAIYGRAWEILKDYRSVQQPAIYHVM